ncbi:MAG: hypothetical protein OEY28_07835, partial [Nitrospira sp.]|nr:hypothetical protein [Nitrospira sp.]
MNSTLSQSMETHRPFPARSWNSRRLSRTEFRTLSLPVSWLYSPVRERIGCESGRARRFFGRSLRHAATVISIPHQGAK